MPLVTELGDVEYMHEQIIQIVLGQPAFVFVARLLRALFFEPRKPLGRFFRRVRASVNRRVIGAAVKGAELFAELGERIVTQACSSTRKNTLRPLLSVCSYASSSRLASSASSLVSYSLMM